MCGGMTENIRTQHLARHLPRRGLVDGHSHLSSDSFGPQQVGNLLLGTADGIRQLGLRTKDADGAFDVGANVHTSFLVDMAAESNKETCLSAHKRAGIIRREMTIAQNLKAFRKDAGFSQVQLAEASGVSQQLISQIENGENGSSKYLADLARALGKKLTDFDASLADVTSDDPFPDRYSKLAEPDKKMVQDLISRLERGAEE